MDACSPAPCLGTRVLSVSLLASRCWEKLRRLGISTPRDTNGRPNALLGHYRTLHGRSLHEPRELTARQAGSVQMASSDDHPVPPRLSHSPKFHLKLALTVPPAPPFGDVCGVLPQVDSFDGSLRVPTPSSSSPVPAA